MQIGCGLLQTSRGFRLVLLLVELAERDQNVIAVAADTLDFVDLRLFQERFPDRLVDVGIAEQNAMGVASGLATTGLNPMSAVMRHSLQRVRQSSCATMSPTRTRG